MIIKKSVNEKLEQKELESLINKGTTAIRMKYFLKNFGNATLFAIISSIIFYSNGLVQNISIGLMILFLLFYYNTRGIDPQEVKDSLKYDRQYVDRSSGIAVLMSEF